MKATIKTAVVTQAGNEVLGKEEKKLYYLIIENELGKKVINVGQGTVEDIRLLENEGPGTPVKPKENETTNAGNKMENEGGKRGRGNGGNN